MIHASDVPTEFGLTLLVSAGVNGHIGYGWLSFVDAGNANYANPTAAYRVQVTIPGVHGAYGGRCPSGRTTG